MVSGYISLSSICKQTLPRVSLRLAVQEYPLIARWVCTLQVKQQGSHKGSHQKRTWQPPRRMKRL